MRDSDSGRRLLAAALLLWLLAGAAAWSSRRLLYNVLFGPFPVSRDDLASPADPDARWEYFVTVEADEVRLLFPRAYAGGREPYSLYGLARVGPRWLVLRLPAGEQGPRLTGTLERLSDFERDHVLRPARQGPGRPRDFLPARLEAARWFRTVGWLTAVLPLAALVLLAAAVTARAVRRPNPLTRRPRVPEYAAGRPAG